MLDQSFSWHACTVCFFLCFSCFQKVDSEAWGQIRVLDGTSNSRAPTKFLKVEPLSFNYFSLWDFSPFEWLHYLLISFQLKQSFVWPLLKINRSVKSGDSCHSSPSPRTFMTRHPSLVMVFVLWTAISWLQWRTVRGGGQQRWQMNDKTPCMHTCNVRSFYGFRNLKICGSCWTRSAAVSWTTPRSPEASSERWLRTGRCWWERWGSFINQSTTYWPSLAYLVTSAQSIPESLPNASI